MMMLTLPIFVPLAHYYGFDLIWFGVIVLLALEMCGDGLEVRPPTNYPVNCATLSVFCSAPIAV